MLSNLLKSKKIIVTGLLFITLLFPTGAFAAASFVLSPSSLSYQLGTTFEVVVKLDTGGAQTTGSDLYFTFDPDYLNLISVNDGNIYSTYLGKTIDNSTGSGSVSGLISPGGETFNGSGTFVTLQFKAMKIGTTNLTIDFLQNNPNDSNVAESGNTVDILGSVTNATYTIAASVSPTGTTGSTTATITSGSGSNGSLPNSGATLPTTIIGIMSVFLIGIGALLIKKV